MNPSDKDYLKGWRYPAKRYDVDPKEDWGIGQTKPTKTESTFDDTPQDPELPTPPSISARKRRYFNTKLRPKLPKAKKLKPPKFDKSSDNLPLANVQRGEDQFTNPTDHPEGKPVGPPIRVFGYVRVSGKSQLAKDGFFRQKADIDFFCRQANLKIAHYFEEQAVSGEVEGMDRPAWIDMVGVMIDSTIKIVVIERLDRLARDLLVQEHILLDMANRGLRVISAAEPDLCSDDPSRRLMRQIVGAIAQYDKAMIVHRLRESRKRAKEKGLRMEGALPYGSYGTEAVILGRMREMRKQNYGFTKIANTLNNEGVMPRQGKKWWMNSVLTILVRPDPVIIAACPPTREEVERVKKESEMEKQDRLKELREKYKGEGMGLGADGNPKLPSKKFMREKLGVPVR